MNFTKLIKMTDYHLRNCHSVVSIGCCRVINSLMTMNFLERPELIDNNAMFIAKFK